MKFQVVIISGSSGVGKETFITLCQKYVDYSMNTSTVDYIKTIAKRCGWTGSKTERDRKFLSDLKKLLVEYDDVPFKKAVKTINDYHLDLFEKTIGIDSTNLKSLVFVHCREPQEIERLRALFNGVTLLITNKNISIDENTDFLNYQYQFIIGNDGNIEDLESLASIFIDKIFGE